MNKRVEQLCSEFDERVSRVGVGWARAEFAKRLAELEGENERLRAMDDRAHKLIEYWADRAKKSEAANGGYGQDAKKI